LRGYPVERLETANRRNLETERTDNLETRNCETPKLRNLAFQTRVLITALTIVVPLSASAAYAQPADDVERALAAVRKSAAAGDAVAQFSLGALLYFGGDYTAEAVDWLLKAAEQQYAPAEFQMGQLYDFGFVVDRDDAEALRWYRRAADHGSAAGQRMVGDFHQKGRGVAASLAEAARWYRRAADGDDIRAQYLLAQLYFDGRGVDRDYVSAYYWYSIAAGQAPLADNRLGLLELRNIAAARMTPEQLAEATTRVAAWKPPLMR
jgi:TPR repeat protein